MSSKTRLFLSLFLFVAFAMTSVAALAGGVPANAKVYIAPMNGFENYLSAALLAKNVPVTIVLDKSQADYVVTGSWRETDGGTSGNGSLVSPLHKRTNYSASIAVIDPKSSAVAFSYSSEKSGSHDLSKQVAEDWANHLGKAIRSAR
ncbi:MAG TPA: hypothetical protein VGU25_13780 [Acidobacteriaceae bacterium]|nr:hypothetical protein [Acidobacteriaceae bacterium]